MSKTEFIEVVFHVAEGRTDDRKQITRKCLLISFSAVGLSAQNVEDARPHPILSFGVRSILLLSVVVQNLSEVAL